MNNTERDIAKIMSFLPEDPDAFKPENVGEYVIAVGNLINANMLNKIDESLLIEICMNQQKIIHHEYQSNIKLLTQLNEISKTTERMLRLTEMLRDKHTES